MIRSVVEFNLVISRVGFIVEDMVSFMERRSMISEDTWVHKKPRGMISMLLDKWIWLYGWNQSSSSLF